VSLDLFKLQVFVTVADCNGYSAAAEHLGLSQATVSFHMRSLEQHVGTPLVRYEHRTVALTAAGEQVYRSAQFMLGEHQRLMRTLRSGHGAQVKLGASMAFEQAFFFDQLIAPFRSAHPEVLLSMRFGHSVRLAEAVRDHELDLAYVIGWHIPGGLRYERLHETTFTFLIGNTHPLASRGRVTIEEIAEAGLISAPLDDVEWAHYEEVLHIVGLGAANVTMEIDGVQARVLAARAGLGVLGVFFPSYAERDACGPLVPLALDRKPPTVEAGLVSPRSEVPSESVRVLGDWIRQVTAEPHQH
jgi:DNA-binding transcriptional LysR family regulator